MMNSAFFPMATYEHIGCLLLLDFGCSSIVWGRAPAYVGVIRVKTSCGFGLRIKDAPVKDREAIVPSSPTADRSALKTVAAPLFTQPTGRIAALIKTVSPRSMPKALKSCVNINSVGISQFIVRFTTFFPGNL